MLFKKFICLFFFMIGNLLPDNYLFAEHNKAVVSIVSSYSIDQYQEILDGFRIIFNNEKIKLILSEYNMENLESNKIYEKVKRINPDVIFTIGTNATELIKKRFPGIPIVFCLVLHPGEKISSNITGVLIDIQATIKLATIKKILPGIKKIGIFYSEETLDKYEDISNSNKQFNFKLLADEIKSDKDMIESIKNISTKIDCFLIIPDSKIYFLKSIENLFLEGLRNNFPVIGLSSSFTKAGALFSLECDYETIGKQSADIIIRILRGEKPSDILPVEPAKTNLSINMIVAERLGIKIPDEIKKEANKTYK